MDRVILHCDLNNFYASVEQKSHPEYDGMPLAVCGNPEARHGIVLAKNMLAKAAGVQTGEAIWMSRKKCPGIVFVPPHYDEYVRYSKEVFSIYTSSPTASRASGWTSAGWTSRALCALRLRRKDACGQDTRDREGAHRAHDLGGSVPSPRCWRSWAATSKNPTPPSCSTANTIWASSAICRPPSSNDRQKHFAEAGKSGHPHHPRSCRRRPLYAARSLRHRRRQNVRRARGVETEEVRLYYDKRTPKSVSHGTTTPRDMTTEEDFRIVVYALAELVAMRLRRYGLSAEGVGLTVREAATLHHKSAQCTLSSPTSNASDIAEGAIALLPKTPRLPAAAARRVRRRNEAHRRQRDPALPSSTTRRTSGKISWKRASTTSATSTAIRR